MKTKVCYKASCACMGTPQPIDQFTPDHVENDGWFKYCNTCVDKASKLDTFLLSDAVLLNRTVDGRLEWMFNQRDHGLTQRSLIDLVMDAGYTHYHARWVKSGYELVYAPILQDRQLTDVRTGGLS